MSILLDPRIFQYVLLGLYACASIRWALAGAWMNVLYWIGAALIVSAVTWGMKA